MSSNEMVGGLSEKGPLALVITGTTVVAFAASNLYVFGVSIGLHHNLASHFEILDYVRITPAWALPAGLVYLFIAAVSLGGRVSRRWSPIHYASRTVWQAMAIKFFGGLLRFDELHPGLPNAFEILFLAVFTLLSFFNHAVAVAAMCEAVLFSRAMAYLLGLVLVALSPVPTFLRTMLGEKTYIGTSVTWMTVLSFAFFFGFLVDPILVRNRSMTRVVLAEEIPSLEGAIGLPGQETIFKLTPKEVEVEGKLIFRLSHSVLLLTKRHGSPLVVIPEEKIERIESLKNQRLQDMLRPKR
jgi:hypothetical protein